MDEPSSEEEEVETGKNVFGTVSGGALDAEEKDQVSQIGTRFSVELILSLFA